MTNDSSRPKLTRHVLRTWVYRTNMKFNKYDIVF